MIRLMLLILLSLGVPLLIHAQEVIPFDTTSWEINARGYIFENYKGQDAIYLQGGIAKLKDTKFKNGTIEFDIYLTERRGFPGIRFRNYSPGNFESFYLRPHQSGNPDANQALPVFNGISAWQLYYGPSYSVAYDYKFDTWTHVKLVIHEGKAQLFLGNSEEPNLSWHLTHTPQEGDIVLTGSAAPVHYANFKVDKTAHRLVNFNVIERESIEGLISRWEVSDMFEEKLLDDPSKIKELLKGRKWGKTIGVDEGTAANISRAVLLRDGSPGNTVFAKITINSDKDQVKLFEFGYSDRVVAVLNDKFIYKGTNAFRTRDYRYLGTIGLFDAIYLDLKKGENTLLLAVSENFGGWLVTGRFENEEGIKVK